MIQLLERLLNNSLAAATLDIMYTLLCNLFISVHLQKINCKDIPKWRCAAFALTLTAVVCLPAYIILANYGYAGAPVLSDFAQLLVISIFSYRNPLWLAAYFFAARFILGLPRQNVSGSALLVFFFSELFALVSNGAEYLYLPFKTLLSPIAGFSVAHILLILCVILLNMAVARFIDRNIHRLKMLFEVGREGKRHVGFTSFLFACAIWSVLAFGDLLITTNRLVAKEYFTPVMIAFISVLIVLTFNIKMKNVALYQASLHNKALFEAIEEFRGVRHDMNNILQVYNGFIQINDFDGLKTFHKTLFDKTIELNEKLEFHRWLKESPALYGLFMSMEDAAKGLGVVFDVKNAFFFTQIGIPDFDLCRLLSNLIINAVESASDSPNPYVQVSVARGLRGEMVVTVTNTTSEKVDTSRMFKCGFSTKPGHSGRGLYEVNRILAKYYGCTVTPAYEESFFVMYLRLPRKAPGSASDQNSQKRSKSDPTSVR